MVRAACVQYSAFSQEPPPEKCSKVCRVIPLQVCGVFAPNKLRFLGSELRVVPRKECPFVPMFGMKGLYFL